VTYHGLFVGIDRYKSPGINWLSAAKRDATALHALFADTLGPGGDLLVDHQATRATIEQRFTDLARCGKDDVVVLAFSGHGSQSHELVTYDADPSALSTTAIPLDTLTEWFSRIPARRLICILDCCFSGGMGAKVLLVESLPRSMHSADQLLNQLAGKGRIVITASTATEEAWENQRLRHGLLTYYLLEALQGAEEVREAGKVSVYRLLDYVTKRVTAASDALGQLQHPTLRGQIDGGLEWPVFRKGAAYAAAFPESARKPATPVIKSLESFDFPPSLLDAWGRAIPALNELQLAAVNDYGLLDGQHLVVTAPTSSGKTMVGELAALRGALERRRAFFLLPLRALVNDKFEQFQRTYGDFGIRTIRATGEISDDVPTLMRGQYDICLMTYEKFAALALTSPHILGQVGTVVIDEVQMIVDASRGAALEFLLTYLRAQRTRGIEPQMIALSAVIGDANGLDRWLGARLLRRHERPVPLKEGILRGDGSFRYLDVDDQELVEAWVTREWRPNGGNQELVIPLVRRLVGEGKQVIVFREQKGETRGCARYLAEALRLPPAQAALDRLPEGDPSAASQDLRDTLHSGIGFHNADLDRDERQVLEEEFRADNTTLRVLVATTTLAMGINTPASAVVVVGLEHPGADGPVPYSIAEYKNIIGRAGRLGFTETGESYIVTLTPNEEHHVWSRYVLGSPEDLGSRFLASGTDPRTLIIKVLAAIRSASRRGLTADEVVEFLEASFGVFQQRQLNQGWTWDRNSLRNDLMRLEQRGLVEVDDAGRYVATPLGRLAGESGTEVESITRLSETLGTLSPEAINAAALVAATQLTVELDQVLIPFNTRSKRKEPQQWSAELRGQNVSPQVLQALGRYAVDQNTGTRRAKRAAACLYYMTDWPLAEVERTITQFGGGFGGAAGPIRAVATRTRDLLPVVVRVVELLHPGTDLTLLQRQLLVRLEIGLPVEAVDLAARLGGAISRADYLALGHADLVSIDAVRAAGDQELLKHLGGSTAKLKMLRLAAEEREGDEADFQPTPLLPPPS
jgi:helicase